MTIPDFKEVHIENTNSCGYKCVMCPREKQTRKIGFMPLSDFSLVLSRIKGFEGALHLHGYGEPLLDRHLPTKIELVHEKLPNSLAQIISTLGVRVKEEYLEKLIRAGLNAIVLSIYGFTNDSYQQVHGYNGFELVKKNLVTLSKIIKDQSSSIDAIIKVPGHLVASSLPMVRPHGFVEFIQFAKSLGYEIGSWTKLINWGSGRNYHSPQKEKICPVISGKRREILNITWDLNVIPCCFDFNSTICFGNLVQPVT